MNKREGITYLSRIKEIEPLFVLFYPILLLILSRQLHVMIKRRGNYTANDVNEICLEHKNLNDITSQGRKRHMNQNLHRQANFQVTCAYQPCNSAKYAHVE